MTDAPKPKPAAPSIGEPSNLEKRLALVLMNTGRFDDLVAREFTAFVAELAASTGEGREPAELLPAERIVLTVAIAQLERGENPPINTTAALALALDRLSSTTPREDGDDE